MAFRFGLVTLFPDYFEAPLKCSLLGKALEERKIEMAYVSPREFARDKFGHVDDAPFGGGAGMVMEAAPLVGAIQKAKALVQAKEAPVVLLSARGKRLTQPFVQNLAEGQGAILVCGRYEGVDDRLLNFVDHEACVTDVVLFGGEAAALVVIEAVSRLIPGVVGDPLSVSEESFSDGLLEYPQFTRPRVFEVYGVPSVLISGNHGKIRLFRRYHTLLTTFLNRPELLAQANLGPMERRLLEKIQNRRYPYQRGWIKRERGEP
jgi:tRNA (guanine37-N1)-methyltransferase